MEGNFEQLVDQFLHSRSRRDFSRIYHHCNPALIRIAVYLCRGNLNDAEDIVQETWITAIERLETFQRRSGFRTWISGILLNKSREFRRKKEKAAGPPEPSSGRVSERGLSNLAIDLKTAILRLPDGYREILTLHDIEGFTHREIAQLLDINEGTSKSQLFQARRAMRKLLTGYKTESWKN